MMRGEPLRRDTPKSRAWANAPRKRIARAAPGEVRVRQKRDGARTASWNRQRKWCEDRAAGRCEANTPGCPPGAHWGDQAHHRRLRAQGGSDGIDNLLWVCTDGHTWIHAHPEASYDAGWMLRAGDA